MQKTFYGNMHHGVLYSMLFAIGFKGFVQLCRRKLVFLLGALRHLESPEFGASSHCPCSQDSSLSDIFQNYQVFSIFPPAFCYVIKICLVRTIQKYYSIIILGRMILIDDHMFLQVCCIGLLCLLSVLNINQNYNVSNTVVFCMSCDVLNIFAIWMELYIELFFYGILWSVQIVFDCVNMGWSRCFVWCVVEGCDSSSLEFASKSHISHFTYRFLHVLCEPKEGTRW